MLHLIDKLAGWWLGWRMDRFAKNDPACTELGLKRVEVGDNGYKIVATAPAIVYLADEAASLLEGIENYVQFDMMPRIDRGLRPVRVTVQWASGKSPAQRVSELIAALTPFAHAADNWDELKKGPYSSYSITDVIPTTMGPYRAAQAALGTSD